MNVQQLEKCEDCYSCCKAFGYLKEGLSDIGPNYNRCSKLCENNRCTIYESRPDVCADYKCLYIDVNLPNTHLPERVGFVSDLRSGPNGKYLNIVPNESATFNIDPATFYLDNIENIIAMKKAVEKQWTIKINVINVSCESRSAQYTFKD